MSFTVDKKYTSKTDTPLARNTFTKYVRCPLGIFYVVGNLIRLNEEIPDSTLLTCINIALLVSVGFEVTFFVGVFGWKRYAYKAKIASLYYAVFMIICLSAIAYGLSLQTFFNIFATGIASYLEYVYYKKRELLFNNEFDDLRQMGVPINKEVEPVKEVVDTNEANKEVIEEKEEKTNQPLYCRKCGTKLEPDSIYCKKCGTKI